MAYTITTECNNCAACEPECPNEAISRGPDIFEINPDACTECVGFHATPRCAAVCPVDSCVTDPKRPESESDLLAKAKALHPSLDLSGPLPSHFRK
jgi:ferredoxin